MAERNENKSTRLIICLFVSHSFAAFVGDEQHSGSSCSFQSFIFMFILQPTSFMMLLHLMDTHQYWPMFCVLPSRHVFGLALDLKCNFNLLLF